MTFVKEPCPICRFADAEKGPNSRDGMAWDFICSRCGEFSVLEGTLRRLPDLTPREQAKLSGYLREEFNLGTRAHLDKDALKSIIAIPEKPIPERLARLLSWCVKRQPDLGETFSLSLDVVSISYSQSFPEVMQLLAHLASANLIKRITTDGKFQVTVDGFIENERSKSQGASNIGFIAMWFDATMNEVREKGLSAGIRGAGYSPVLVNNVEHVNKIDDEIVAQIRKSRFLVADFTGHRGGVYFEAGFAMGLSLPVFWTCRKDDLSKLHFDIRQYNCIDWETPEELAVRLSRRIEAVIGAGRDQLGS